MLSSKEASRHMLESIRLNSGKPVPTGQIIQAKVMEFPRLGSPPFPLPIDSSLASRLDVSQTKEVINHHESTCFLPEVLVKGARRVYGREIRRESFRGRGDFSLPSKSERNKAYLLKLNILQIKCSRKTLNSVAHNYKKCPPFFLFCCEVKQRSGC